MEKNDINKKAVFSSMGEAVLAGLVLFSLALAMLWTIFGLIFPTHRMQETQYVQDNYIFLKAPTKKFASMFEDKERKVVFLNNSGQPIAGIERSKLESQNIAILYAAEVESQVGKQEWLQEAYQSYVLTPQEVTRLNTLAQAYKEKQRAVNSNFEIRVEEKQKPSEKSMASIQETLLERGLLAKL